MDASGVLKVFHITSVVGKYVARSSTIHTGYESVCSDISVTNEIPTTNSTGQTESMKDLTYVASICQKQLSVFTVSFGIQIAVSLAYSAPSPRKGQANSVQSNELTTWIDNDQQRILVVCWASIIEVYHVLSDSAGQVTLQRTSQFDQSRPILSASPLEGNCVLFVDDNKYIHVFDARLSTVAQTTQIDINFGLASFGFASNEKTVYSSTLTKSTRYHGQISHIGGTVSILGKSRVLQCSLKTWEERLNEMLSASQWDGVFSLAKDLAQDMAVAVVGMSNNITERKASINRRIEDLLSAYLDYQDSVFKPTGGSGTGINQNNAHLVPAIDKVINLCSETQLQDLYYSCVMPKLGDLKANDRGLYALEDALLSGKFNTVPTEYISNFAKLFRTPSRFNSVNLKEPCGMDHAILRMEMALTHVTNDLGLLITTAGALQLYRLLCCILSYRQHKHVEALQAVLPDAAKNTGSMAIAFEYIEKLFEDKSLVEGKPIVPMYRKTAKESVISFLVSDPKSLNEILKYDANRFIACASKLISVNAENSSSNPWGNTAKTSKSSFVSAIYSQLIDSTIPPNRPWEYERKKWPSYSSILQTYITFSVPIASKIVTIAGMTSDEFVLRACYHFTNAFEKANYDRRGAITSAFVSLITSDVWNDGLTSLIENEIKSKRLGRVHAALLARHGDYQGAIACYLSRDYLQLEPTLDKGVFEFLSSEMEKLQLLEDETGIENARFAVKSQLANLAKVDATSLAQLVFEYLPNDHNDVFKTLQATSGTFLLYMRGMISKGDKKVNEDKYAQNTYINLLAQHEPEAVYDYIVKNDQEIQYDLGQALSDCKANRITDATIFLLEKTMQIAEAMETLMSAITLHLKNLRTEVIQQPAVFEQKLFGVATKTPTTDFGPSLPRAILYDNDKGLVPMTELESKLIKMVNIGIDLCTRYHQKLSTDQLSILWFQLLDRFASPKRLLHDRSIHIKEGTMQQFNYHNPNLNQPCNGFEDNEVDFLPQNGNFPILTRQLTTDGTMFLTLMHEVYARYISHVLTAMVKSLPLSTVVGKIIKDNERDQFGPFKPIIVGILETLSFDLEANRLCKLCADADTVIIANDLKQTATSALVPASHDCGICTKPLSVQVGNVDSLRLYPCGHGFHEVCCGTLDQCYICSDYDEQNAFEGAPTPNFEAARIENTKKVVPQDVNYILRRLQYVKSKLDNSKVYKEMLESVFERGNPIQERAKIAGGIIIDGVDISDIDTKGFGGNKNLLLAPAPSRAILSVDDILCREKQLSIRIKSGKGTTFTANLAEGPADEELTEADLIAIFGKHSYENMKRTEKVDDQFDEGAEEEWGDDDQLRELMSK
eukprot:GILJ01013131.1.p1 GENE.GILJ01013131.1~~GILJ01013131.1.p1  ORF type:complete len:1444 (+),score=161.43 GILJ01013131.1:290-4333(+)